MLHKTPTLALYILWMAIYYVPWYFCLLHSVIHYAGKNNFDIKKTSILYLARQLLPPVAK